MGNSPAKEEVKTTTPAKSQNPPRPKTKNKQRYRHKNQMDRKYTTIGQGGVSVCVIKGDLTTEKTDVVVCTANKNLDLNRGRASKVLLENGGDGLQKECSSKYIEGIDHGDIAVVKGGKLACKYVYFVALPIWTGNQTDRQKLYDLLQKCYMEADSYGSQSLALPALGTGFLKYPADVVAQTTFKALEDFSNSNPSSSLKNVSVIVYYQDIAAFQAFENEAKARSCGTKTKFSKNVVKKKSTPNGAMGINAIMSGNALVRGNSIGEIKIKVCHGKLAECKAHVLINCTTNDLNLNNGGLSGSLLEAAGEQLQNECYDKYPNGIRPGEIAVTQGYNLPCKKVYHGSLPQWNDSKSYNSKKIKTLLTDYNIFTPNKIMCQRILHKFVENCLDQVENDGLSKMAFPALGTGSLHYPPEVSAETILKCILQHERNHPETNLIEIRIVVYDEMANWRPIMGVYEDQLQELRTKAMASFETSNNFQLAQMETVLKNALERGAEKNVERGTKEWFNIMFKSDPRAPKYWSHYHGNKSLKDWIMESDDLKPVVVSVDKDTFDAVSQLVQDTWESKYVGQGRDAAGLGDLNYSKVKVMKVERIENCQVFKKYAQKRQELFHKASKEGGFSPLEDIMHSSGPIKVHAAKQRGTALCEDIYPEICEYYMFHGTKPSVVDGIVKQGLDSRLAGSSAMFGQGVYGAESSTKSDQYADEKSHRTDGEKKMFLIRICLGKMCLVSRPHPFARAPCINCTKDKCLCKDDEFYDSVVGDGSWNFREFVVYDRTQVYPEYIITYVRK